MQTPGRLAAAIEVLVDFEARRVPLKTILADWARGARYAGSKDRAWISGLCLDVLRRRHSLTQMMDDATPRALVLAAMHFIWKVSLDDLAAYAADDHHGPGALTEEESEKLSKEAVVLGKELSAHIRGDFPEWMTPHVVRAFGEDAPGVMASFAERADVDLRLNTLKTEPEKSLSALSSVKGKALPMLKTAARIAAPPPSEKAPAVTIIPAFNKGWVEVQDLGSQIAAAAAGKIEGAQVLDYCAGGGGKTLALAALMNNTGQLYAYDRDPRRLKPLYHRAKRAGVRNLQMRNPAGEEDLDDLQGKMDLVFVDAPCTGAGTWRRHPDTKWRVSGQQLFRRMKEQDDVLAQAARFARPGGRMVYVTCSFLVEENEDRLAEFLKSHPEFKPSPALEQIAMSGLLTDEGRAVLETCSTPAGAIRITPDKIRADGFFIAVLERAA